MKKGKRPTLVKIVQKSMFNVHCHLVPVSHLLEKGKPTATIISIKGGPAITLAAKGTKTTFAGKAYTVTPTAGATSKDNGAAGLYVMGSTLAKFVAVMGGAFGGMMLVL